MGRRPIYKSDEFFKSTPLVDQIYLDMTAVAHRTGVAPFGIRSRQQGVRAGLKSLEAAEADLAIARFFYANGLSFAAASGGQDSYYRAMIKKIQAAPCGYIPPNRNKHSGPLLDECHEWMWKKIGERDPDGMRAMRFCSTCVARLTHPPPPHNSQKIQRLLIHQYNTIPYCT